MTPCDTLQVSKAELDQSKSWTEAEYLALGDTNSRIELIDGGLWVSPHADYFHQRISAFLQRALEPAADAADLLTTTTYSLRLAPDRIVIPDIIVAERPTQTAVGDAADAVLVVEVLSPSNASYDRIYKRYLYAEAGIAWYLLAEPDMSDYASIELRLLKLESDHYTEHAAAKHGETLKSDDPFPIEIETAALVRYALSPGRGPSIHID